MAAVGQSPPASSLKSDKKQRKEKKKRSREDDPLAADERKHKRSKSTANRAVSPDLSASAHTDANDSAAEAEKPAKKSKKTKKSKHDAEADDAVQEVAEKKRRKSRSKDDEDLPELLQSSAKKSSKKSSKKSKKQATPESSEDEAEAAASSSDSEASEDQDSADAMDIDAPLQTNAKSTSRLHQPLDTPAKPRYPFFTQTVSLFLPIYPIGWAGPCTAAATQHLQPMVNRYVPVLGGVLLGFRNVAVSERPGRQDAATDDSDACDLASIDEFAVGFGYVTADVDLFVPKRGAWMEGSVNLESEGHVGVVCWGKFNASIESARLPPEWRWVHSLGADEATATHDDTVSNFTAEEQHGAVRQIHATGYWVDGAGHKIKGRVRFRVKSFDVGVSGDHGYLSLEGTMLDAAGEADARRRDAQQELRRRKGKSGGVLRKERRLVPEFSVTKFGEVEDEEEKALAQEVWEHTEPAKDPEETAQDGEYAGITHEGA